MILIVRSTWGIHITLLAAFCSESSFRQVLDEATGSKLKKKDPPYHQHVQLSILDPDNIYTYIHIYSIYMYIIICIYIYVNTYIYIYTLYINFERCEPSGC